jgi:RND family efflux transporter MFP subunit
MYWTKIISAAAITMLSGCGSQTHPPKQSAPAAPVAVTVAGVTAEDWPSYHEATGSVRARASMAIAARIMGYVHQIAVREGDFVRAGQRVVTIEARELNTALEQAQAALSEARSAEPEAAAAIVSATAQLDLANAGHRRMQDLLEKRSITQQEYDEAAARLRMASAGLQMAQARQRQLIEKIRQGRQAVESANVMHGYTEIRAPFAGMVTSRKAEPGTLAAPGMTLLEIEQEGGYRFEARVDESRALAGREVEVAIDAFEGRVNGHIAEIVPAVDAASRTFLIKIDLPRRAGIRSGMSGRAYIPTASRKVLTIPAGAVRRESQVESVFVPGAAHARRRLITTGASRLDRVEVLSGLAAGEKIVHPVPATLADGSPIEVRP